MATVGSTELAPKHAASLHAYSQVWAHDPQHSIPTAKHGLWPLSWSGARRMAHRLWHMACGQWPMAQSALSRTDWCMVYELQ